jgi:hypothetical protein
MVDCAVGPLPDEAYVPGKTARPAEGPVFAIARRAPEITDPAGWAANEAYLFGVHLYRNGYFWEAHEVWEPVWQGTRPSSAERHLMQGLIQLANGCLKVAMGRLAAARRLADHAGTCFDEAALGGFRRLMGIDPRAAGQEARAYLEFLQLAENYSCREILAKRPALMLTDAPC